MIKLIQKKILSDTEIDQGYDLIRNKFLQIKTIFPPKYSDLKIEYVVLPKATSIHTLINNNYLNYLTYKKKNNFLLNYFYKFYLNHIFKKSKQNYFQNLKPESNFDHLSKNTKFKIDNKKYNLFFANMGSYLYVIQKYIEKSKLTNNKIIITKDLYKPNSNMKNFIIFDEFLSNNIIDEYNESKESFKKCFNENQDFLYSLFNIENFNFYKCSYYGFKNTFEKLIPEAYLYLKALDNLFNNINANNVISIRNRRIFDRAVNLKSYELNIENYILLHSNVGNTSKFINEMGHLGYIKNAFVWNDFQSNAIKKSKYTNIINFYTYGSPLFDSIKLNSKDNLNDNKSIFIPGGTIKYSKTLIYSLINKAQINHKYRINIKYHPNDSSDQFLFLEKKKNIEIFNRSENIIKIISKSKLMITDLSESSILAMILNKPVFFISMNDYISSLFQDIYYFNKMETNIFCFNNLQKLSKSVDLIMNDTQYYEEVVNTQKKYIENFISKQNFHIDECSNKIDKILNA